jgi:predicted O-methyltransferase YrrM
MMPVEADRVSRMSMARFEKDWFSRFEWQFERQLKPFAGTPCRVLEIGCHEGRATCWLLDNILTHPDSSITCIDFDPQPTFRTNIATRPNGHCVTLKVGLSRDVLRTLEPGTFDFIYIDGSHATIDVWEDATHSFRLAKVGAIIAFDDFKWRDWSIRSEGFPKPAIKAFLKIYRPKLQILAKNYQVWVRKLAE